MTRARTLAQKCQITDEEHNERIIELIIASTPHDALRNDLYSKSKGYSEQTWTRHVAKGGRAHRLVLQSCLWHQKGQIPLNMSGPSEAKRQPLKVPTHNSNCWGTEPKVCKCKSVQQTWRKSRILVNTPRWRQFLTTSRTPFGKYCWKRLPFGSVFGVSLKISSRPKWTRSSTVSKAWSA